MTIAIIGLMNHEPDIAELWVRHHCRLGRLYVVNDSRVDGTTEILRRLQEEGLSLTVWSSGMPALSYRQAIATNAAIRKVVAETNAQWILPLDADEFIQAKTVGELSAGLAAIPSGQCGCYSWQTFVPARGGYDQFANPLYAIFRRRVPDSGLVYKAILPRDVAETCSVSVGSHCVYRPDGSAVYGTEMPFHLAHVPVRSPDQHIAREIPICSKVRGPGQEPQKGGYFANPWLRGANFKVGDDTLYRWALGRVCEVVKGPNGEMVPEPTDVDPASRMVGWDLEMRYRDLARIRLFEVLGRHVDDLEGALGGRAGEMPKIDIEALRRDLPKHEAIAAIERHVETLSRALHTLNGGTN